MESSNMIRMCFAIRSLERCSFVSHVHSSLPRFVTVRPISAFPDISNLRARGLKSIEKFVDVRQGEILKADMFENKIFASNRPRRESIFTVKNDNEELPAETQLQSRNRNPRNMELLGYNKPRGYGTLYKRRDFWNRLNLVISNSHITAFVDHHTGEVLVSASTQEFSIARHLWSNTDVSAAVNIGRIIAERCKECGIERVFWRMKNEKRKERVQEFMQAVKEQGLCLTEPRRIVLPHSFTTDNADLQRNKKKKRIKSFTASIKRKHTYF